MHLYLAIYVALVVLVFAGLLALDLHGYLIKPEKRQRRHLSYSPKALVILPMKGMDLTLNANLKSIKKQDYPNYKIVAVVDDEGDAALPVVKKLGISFTITKEVCKECSGKVNAILSALEYSASYKPEIFVVADSDITVPGNWLSALADPLYDNSIGISTTFPKFVPYRGGFWSEAKMVWGFVGLSLLENDSTRFAWGGSMAFRRGLVDSKGTAFIRESGYGLSDDVSLTKLAKMRMLKIAYTSAVQPVVKCRETFGSFAEWANRQTAFTLLGYRKNLYYGLLFYCSEIFIFLSAFILFAASPLSVALLLHSVLSVAKAMKRSGGKHLAIAAIALLMPFIYAANLLKASRMDEISWRGRRYVLPDRKTS